MCFKRCKLRIKFQCPLCAKWAETHEVTKLVCLLHQSFQAHRAKINPKKVYGPTQVKCWLLISNIFYAMNFQHILEMMEFNLWHF